MTDRVDYDREIVADTLGGDREAFSFLVKKYQKRVYSVARAIVGVHEDAEDAVQEAFIQAFQKLHTFDTELSFGPWIATIVGNKARDIARKRKVKEVDTLEDDPYTEGRQIVSDAQWNLEEFFDLNDRLSRALRVLPERQRIVIVMYSQGFSHSEISEAIGIPNGTSRSELSIARNRLRTVLEVQSQA